MSRICPGRHFAENSVFIGIASMLASFNFEKAIGEDGKSITPEVVYTTDFNRHPLPFKCSITPRNNEIVALVKQTVEMEI
ncbi:cytochrome P450 [Pyrrhoderma noxium]|uniref:Cytochrome P450 n=1 Tax=Pyrrhoderma noxium TaxID=2282107 RepID=A0A286UCB0_9AGAM|nr:cytochrome P450 [Pyrrhoderma noxium]